ncbi:MAG: cupin, partial [Akkermansiaceae bacterium]|nr:cupin [Akkermansiaceae bacterium]
MTELERDVSADTDNPDRTPMGVLLALASLGAAQALWAAFQWYELGEMRRGGETLCDLVGGGCGVAWNSPAATAIHEATGLPVAAWGVVWGVAAAAAALFRLKSERNELNGAIRLLAAAGVLACLALTVLLLQNGAICMTCLVTYGLVLGYAAIAFWVPLGGVDWALGAAIAAGFCAVVFGLALLAGRDTPTETAQSGSVEV